MVGAVFLAVCALRGPGLFWLEFWTAPVVRSLLVTVIVAWLLWSLAGAWGVARRFSGSAADGAALQRKRYGRWALQRKRLGDRCGARWSWRDAGGRRGGAGDRRHH